MDFEMSIVIDESILNKIPEYNNKYVGFLLFWLQEKNTKCVVIKSSWKKFNTEWDKALKKGDVKDSFFRFIKGIVRPYRKEGYENEEEDKNPINEITKIVNRDYDMVEYLVVESPNQYRGKLIKVSNENIVDLKGLYTANEVANTEIFKEFSKYTK